MPLRPILALLESLDGLHAPAAVLLGISVLLIGWLLLKSGLRGRRFPTRTAEFGRVFVTHPSNAYKAFAVREIAGGFLQGSA